MDLLRDINKSGSTLVIVTHDEDIAKRCSKTIRLNDGVIVNEEE